jgi:hypothetical protein
MIEANRSRRTILALALALGVSTAARAQTPPLPAPVPVPTPEPPPALEPVPAEPDPEEPRGEPGPEEPPAPAAPTEPEPWLAAPPPWAPVRSEGLVLLPEILVAPSGRLLPAAAIYSRSALDTGGGLSSDARVGLGDVAEFGVAMTDLIRRRADRDADPVRVWPFATASFRMGVAEHRLFRRQPALALGFRKSFERQVGDHTTRLAALDLAATVTVTPKVILHGGAVFWDGAIEHRTTGEGFALHDHPQGLRRQLRPFGGFELRPLDHAQVLVDLFWVPELCLTACGNRSIALDAVLSWGVRYEVRPTVFLESGVRVQGIDEANLLDAQIFGQLTFVTWRLRRLVGDLR